MSTITKRTIPLESNRPDRAAKRTLAAHVDQSVFREFKILTAELSTTTEGALAIAVALLFERYGKPVPEAVLAKLEELDLEPSAIGGPPPAVKRKPKRHV